MLRRRAGRWGREARGGRQPRRALLRRPRDGAPARVRLGARRLRPRGRRHDALHERDGCARARQRPRWALVHLQQRRLPALRRDPVGAAAWIERAEDAAERATQRACSASRSTTGASRSARVSRESAGCSGGARSAARSEVNPVSEQLDRRLVAVMFTDMVGCTGARCRRTSAWVVDRRDRYMSAVETPPRGPRRDDRPTARRRQHEHVPELARRSARRSRDPAGAPRRTKFGFASACTLAR